MKARVTRPLAAAILGCILSPAFAQTAATSTPPATPVASTAASGSMATSSGGGTTVPSGTTPTTTVGDRRTPPLTRLTSDFSTLAGSQENASALIGGLRSGRAITLSGLAESGSGTPTTGSTSTTFTAPNGPMSYGNIRIALSLAREQLAREGISNPTPQQLQTALVGGTAANGSGATTGILERRAAGMGWGRIAHDMGMKLGPVVSGHGSKATTVTATSATGALMAKTSERVQHRHVEQHHRSGIVTAAGSGHAVKSGGAHQHRHAEQHQSHHRHAAATPRVVTAAGATTAGAYHGSPRTGGGVVTAAGAVGELGAKKGGGHGKS